MKDKLVCKSRMISTVVPKFHFKLKKRIKQERSLTPQRWSRRLRALPPIPIKIIKTCRKSISGQGRNSCSDTCLNVIPNKNIMTRNKAKNIIVNGNKEENSVEVIRIVPIIIYAKNNLSQVKAFINDYHIQLTQKSEPFASLNELLKQKIKKECMGIEKKWSKRLKNK